MIDVEKFRTEGYLYDSMENYFSIINFEDYKNLKLKIDEKDIKRFAKYDYWYKFNNCSYQEEIVYSDFLKKDADKTIADIVFQKSHEYMLKKIDECAFEPTWVFGTNLDNEIGSMIHQPLISNFQKEFKKLYYTDKEFKSYYGSNKLQFYDKGCKIRLHDDGKDINRLCVFIYFLNTKWNPENGGHLIVYDKNNNPIKLNPVFPNFAVLDSNLNLFHEVEKVKNDIKYNIVSFYNGIN